MYDTSAYPADHPAGLPRVNKKVIGLMKDEACRRQVEEFVELRSKLYAFKIHGYDNDVRRCKLCCVLWKAGLCRSWWQKMQRY